MVVPVPASGEVLVGTGRVTLCFELSPTPPPGWVSDNVWVGGRRVREYEGTDGRYAVTLGPAAEGMTNVVASRTSWRLRTWSTARKAGTRRRCTGSWTCPLAGASPLAALTCRGSTLGAGEEGGHRFRYPARFKSVIAPMAAVVGASPVAVPETLPLRRARRPSGSTAEAVTTPRPAWHPFPASPKRGPQPRWTIDLA